MNGQHRNRNRGYQQLRVWQDAVEIYVRVCRAFRSWPFELKRVVGNQVASADSVHRNIAEGYCRRYIREYIQHLNIALGSLGETVSGFVAYHSAGQLPQEDFDDLDALAYRLENGLLKMVEGLERKRDAAAEAERDVVRECNEAYDTATMPLNDPDAAPSTRRQPLSGPHLPISPMPQYPTTKPKRRRKVAS